jgi:PAS domain S-box-containing protein
MKSNLAVAEECDEDDVAVLVNNLHRTQQRLRQVAGRGVDAITLPDGNVYFLLEAQESLRRTQEARDESAALQATLLNTLPAHIALLDRNGIIVSVNEGWRRFAESNGASGSGTGVGDDYLAVCDKGDGDSDGEGGVSAAGIRAVMSGAVSNFSIEYPCHSPTEQRWFQLMVRPLEKGAAGGAVVMHLDITVRKEAEERLRESRALLNMASQIGHIGGWAVELPSLALTWSDEVRAIHGVPADYVPTVETGIEFYLPESRLVIRDALNLCIRDGTPFDVELQIVTIGGEKLWVRAIGQPLRNAAGISTCIQGAFQDITDRKAGEDELKRVHRALRIKMLSNCNETLIWAETERELLDKICKIVIEEGGYRMAWVGYAEEDNYRSIKTMVHAGAEDGYLSRVKLSWSADHTAGRGPAGKAIRTGRAVVCDDMSRDPGFAPFLPAAREHGYSGTIYLPLHDGERTFGVLGIYTAEVKKTTADELSLLAELAEELAFGILNLRERSEQRRVESSVSKVAESVSAASGSDFFEQLARSMADAVGAQAGFVTKLLPGKPLTCRIMGAVTGGEAMESCDYPVKGTPSENLLTSETCVITDGVSERYPDAPKFFVALGFQGYVGIRLTSSTGLRLGHLAVVFREPLKQTDFITSTIQIFAARASSEMERIETDSRIREQASLLDNARDAIIVRDLDHRILFWNQGAERLYGWTAGEALGRSAKDLLHTDSAAWLSGTKTTLTAGGWEGELHQVNKNKRPLIVEVHWSLVRDGDGKPKSILCINTDITERKKMEEQYFRAQRLESIGTLASGLAHDLNNILAPIMMCAPLLREIRSPDEKDKLVRAIEMSAQRGAHIVRQVLIFGRGVQGERAPLRIGTIVQEIVQIAGETFPKSIRIEQQIADELTEIMGDVTQWHQVVMNLSVNARDAMADGGVLRITASNLYVDAHYAGMTPGLSEGPHIAIEVSDTGSGIPPEVAEHIFDPFFTTKEVGKGTGLGLSTVLGIVRNHGGVINLTSSPGSGTTFRIIVPAAGSAAPASTGLPEEPIPGGNGKTVLIVDDEEMLRVSTRAVLEKHGYRTLVAADGIEALALFSLNSAKIDAVLTDIDMPNMGGVTLIRALRRLRPDLPVIVSTGQSEGVDAAKLEEIGVKVILKKPYKGDLLLRKLDAAVNAAPEKLAA